MPPFDPSHYLTPLQFGRFRSKADVSRVTYRFRFMRTRLASADAAEEIACAGAAGC
jgi:hypothetical protein